MIEVQAKHDTSADDEELKREQLRAEFRMFGSLLFLFGLCSAYASLAGMTNISSTPVLNTAKIIVFVDGLALTIIGYCAAVLDRGSTRLCSLAVGLSFLTFTQFLVRFAETINYAFRGGVENVYIPYEYNPTKFDVQFIALMSFISYAALAVGYVGSLVIVTCSMRSIQNGKLIKYTSKYFKRNATILTLALVLYGFSHFSLGCFLFKQYGAGPLPYPITNAGVFKIICFPELGMFAGFLQLFTGAVGFIESLRGSSKRACAFQALCLVNYLSIVALQVLAQIVFAPGTQGSQYLLSLPCNHVGFLTMVAFLEWKTKT